MNTQDIADDEASSPQQRSLVLENSRSQSATTLADGPHALKARVRRSRWQAARRNSFSIGAAAHNRDQQLLDLRELSPNRHSFLHSLSLPGIDTGEKWPERICRLLTNDQTMSARLKMFQYFSDVLTGLQNCNDASLPQDLLPKSAAITLESGAWSICKPGKPNGGEDAYFAGVDSFAGVADGVGEWGDYGCCPRQFAFALMEGSCEKAMTQPFHTTPNAADAGPPEPSKASERALEVLRAGFHRARSIDGCFGSSTALVAGLDYPGERLGIACLGDSSCIVLRRSPPHFKNMTIIKRTREQQHFFNCPYQLSRLPEPEDLPDLEERGLYKLIRVLANMRPEMTGDSPEQADLIDISVREGDLVILGTDGLFDNLFDHEIISLASLALSPFEARLFTGEGKGNNGAAGADPRSCRGPLDFARRLTRDWVKRKRAHPLALDPPSLLNSKKRSGVAHCDQESTITVSAVSRVESLPDLNADTPDDSMVGSIYTPAELVARAVAEAAFYRSLDSRAKSPFAKAARAAGGAAAGGKEDDITVVACWVVAG